MKTHQEIDQRSLALARAVVSVIDRDLERKGLRKARENCSRWYRVDRSPAIAEWLAILKQDWPQIRKVLLDKGEEGRRLRQNSPFCGVLSPRERWDIYRRFQHESKAA